MKYLLSLLIIVGIGATNLSAQEYNLHIPDFNDIKYCENVVCEGVGCALTNAQIQKDIEDRNKLIKIKYLNLNYDEIAEKLIVEAEIDTTTGKTANFFHLVITDGDLDVGRSNCESSVGHLYVDFTNEASPKVSVFSFNGHLNLYCNNGESHQSLNISHNGYDDTIVYGDGTGPYVNKASLKNSFYAKNSMQYVERIFNSISNPNAVKFSIDTTTNSKIINLELDVSSINSHQVNPWLLWNKSYTYEGIKFADRVGVWFWAAANATTAYTGNFLSTLGTLKTDCSTCTHPELETKSKVMCGASNVTVNPVEVGKSTTLSFDVINKDYFDTDKAPVVVSYTGLPDGAKPSVPNGEEVVFAEDGQNGKATINIEWTPTEGQAGDYVIGANFLVEYGLNNLYTECTGVKVKVNEVVPACKQADLDIINQADLDMGRLNEIAKELENRIKKVRSKIGGRTKVDSFDPDAQFTTGWSSYHKIVGNGIYLFECENIDSCADNLQVSTLDSDVDTFQTSIDNLKSIDLTRANKLQRALVKLYVKNGMTVSAARTKAKKIVDTNYRQGKNNDGIDPTYNSATSFVDLHVKTYGTTRYSAESIASLEESCGLVVGK